MYVCCFLYLCLKPPHHIYIYIYIYVYIAMVPLHLFPSNMVPTGMHFPPSHFKEAFAMRRVRGIPPISLPTVCCPSVGRGTPPISHPTVCYPWVVEGDPPHFPPNRLLPIGGEGVTARAPMCSRPLYFVEAIPWQNTQSDCSIDMIVDTRLCTRVCMCCMRA